MTKKFVFQNDFYSYISIICFLLLIIAVFPLPLVFYKFLRVFICIGAIIMASKKFSEPFQVCAFALIAYLFNPLAAIHLFQKSLWMPVDIISALMFLANTFNKKKNKSYIPYANSGAKKNKKYGRDRKY